MSLEFVGGKRELGAYIAWNEGLRVGVTVVYQCIYLALKLMCGFEASAAHAA